jgi:hypothetical protein
MLDSNKVANLVGENLAAAEKKRLVDVFISRFFISALGSFALIKNGIVSTETKDSNLVLDSGGHSNREGVRLSLVQIKPIQK